MATARTKTPTTPKKSPPTRKTAAKVRSAVTEAQAGVPSAAKVREKAPGKVQEKAALGVGDKAPSFALADAAGVRVTSSSLAGKPYVLYFYPKDNTPGCTQEACAFRDQYRDFKKLGVEVLGVSPDSVKTHQGFTEKQELPFRLLSDESKELASAYGVWALKKNYGREFMGIVRSTFLVDAAGKIVQAWRGVRVNGHVEAVALEAKKVSRS
jgi:thioredoxin-dependent peroxiredoxin